jgi:hypothetical protein
MRRLKSNKIVDCADYHELWQWSVNHIEAFWVSPRDYFEIISRLSMSKLKRTDDND